MFILGLIAGLLISILTLVTMTYFRRVIEHKVTVIEKQIEMVGPRPKGFIIEPDSEADEIRAGIIARNRSQGRDTKLSELE